MHRAMNKPKWFAYKALLSQDGWFAGDAYSNDPLNYFPTWREAFDYAFKEASK